ncbi:hypothetical protein M426DRAFT_7049 [Hypoxylon sp. CI-4A]|nr:hypothetical protein M426DRAFT_7049 [Hypoxylon sp. CI-4A]
MAPLKPRCTFKECKSAAQRIVGDCGFCDGHFCAKHRLLEDHKCSGLEDVSMSPASSPSAAAASSTASSTDDEEGVYDPFEDMQWWLVGLPEVLFEEECACVVDDLQKTMLTLSPKPSARKNRTSATRPSSRPRGHKSSGVYKKRYPHSRRSPRPTTTATSHRRRSPTGLSASATTSPTITPS